MKKLFATLGVLALLVVGALTGKAQSGTTYSQSNVPFVCNAYGRYPLTSLYQFNCRGLWFNNHDIEFFFYGGDRVLFSQTSTGLSGLGTFTQTGLTLPNTSTNPVTPGTFAFNWSYTDQNGVAHTGSAAGTWLDFKDSSGWYHAELLSNSLTVQ
jgi:hypothetical protein